MGKKLLEIRTLKVEMSPDHLIAIETEKVQNTRLGAHVRAHLESGETAFSSTGYSHTG